MLLEYVYVEEQKKIYKCIYLHSFITLSSTHQSSRIGFFLNMIQLYFYLCCWSLILVKDVICFIA